MSLSQYVSYVVYVRAAPIPNLSKHTYVLIPMHGSTPQ